ncbi:MAG TPA: hypothetical protein VGY76_05900 [Solirubrobacteraceae bacterium]|jgi:hypothetical protein|nr:hypothetical protein [Solirubrobacteraceae bacterium]
MSQPAARGGHRRFRLALLPTLLALLTLASPTIQRALADGDPASDVLLGQDAFYPYQPQVSPALEAVLNKLLGSTARAGIGLKVAIIGSAEDLGADPRFFGHPQAYARYLDREISFNHVQPLLVVMPAGFGMMATGPARALATVSVDSGHGSDGLTRTAILAVLALARAQGHPLAAPSLPGQGSGGGPPAMLLFGIPAVLLILVGIATLRSGESSEQDQLPRPPPA